MITKMITNSKTVLALTFVISSGFTLIDSVMHVASAGFIGVPSNYVYDTSGRSGPVSRHDYCTNSPDEFPNPFGSNADFRGPCARHDLCYDSPTDKKKCDVRLLQDMYTNCKNEYGPFNPVRHSCLKTAGIYFKAVVIAW
ncbi:hypothetical protein H6F51_24660 [Cyanobacteria bacterium FACHB-DQ100]|nr:hypothetical protein [Cyanobacteria bacterium FACHB-DQ100]